jgi:hypothetical protein
MILVLLLYHHLILLLLAQYLVNPLFPLLDFPGKPKCCIAAATIVSATSAATSVTTAVAVKAKVACKSFKKLRYWMSFGMFGHTVGS